MSESSPESESNDLPLSAWELEPEPTTLIALWSGGESPTQTEVISALESTVQEPVGIMEEMEPPEGTDVLWCAVLDVPDIESPVFIFAEPGKPLEPGELGDEAAESAKWVVGVEAVLDPEDPLRDLIRLVRLLAAAFPDAPAILDVNSTGWVLRQQLDEIFLSDEVEPPAEILWTIHLVEREEEQRSGDAEAPSGKVWLHTHGLWRCGQPELEMLQVPSKHARSAAELINDIASLLMESRYPEPGEPIEIGDELVITLQPWETAIETIPPDEPGGAEDREGEENPHGGPRAIICARHRSSDGAWIWPEQIVTRLEQGEGVVYRTQRATQRQARLAQHAWGQLATAFASARQMLSGPQDDRSIVFLLKAGMDRAEPAAAGDVGREHLWFEAQRFEGDRAEVRLISSPRWVEELQPGTTLWIERDAVSDWEVLTPYGGFGPSALPALWRAIDMLREGDDAS